MNFFEHQDKARRKTKVLVLLLFAAVAGLIAMTTVLIIAVVYGFQFTGERQVQAYDRGIGIFELAAETMSWPLFGAISLVVIAVVTMGSLYKLLQLRGGGRTVAEAMGGRLLNINTRDGDEKKVLNVVEEMAIASGTPVPPVYLIEDQSINAFAAGFNPQDAVIGITRGCIQLLDRDELQGVVAHEFSHIFHGDMRLNIRLVGILHGILLLGLIGYFILRGAGYRSYSSRRGKNAAAMAFLGLGLMIVGYAGTFFGNIIKAAVSRQREFLADASAVQFTRNPQGIGGALKKIGGYVHGSMLQSSHAAEFSHMYFGQGIKTHFNALMATHPAVALRIKRIEPNWDGRYPKVERPATDTITDSGGQTGETTSQFAEPGFDAPEQTPPTKALTSEEPSANAIDSIGAPTPAHVHHAHNLLATMPESIREATKEPFAARALMYALLIDKDAEEVRRHQWQSLRQHAHPVVYKLTEKLFSKTAELNRELYLPAIELCVPVLKNLSEPQFRVFKRNLIELIRADNKVNLFEWSLYRIVIHNLEVGIKGWQKTAVKSLQLKHVGTECQQLMSVLGYAAGVEPHVAKAVYERAMAELNLPQLPMLSAQSIQLPMLDTALEKLRRLKPLAKPQLLKAMANCITADKQVTATEAELFRAIADSLDCPVPPLLANQKIS